MNWQLAISRNRDALLAVVAALMVLVGLGKGGARSALPRFLYTKALLILRQAESAMRRVIVMAAHELALRGVMRRKARVSSTNFALLPAPSNARVSMFNLIDPLKTFGRAAPDFSAFGLSRDTAAPVCAASLAWRIAALKNALDTIPHQAKRLLRWYEARDQALARYQPHRLSPIRPGPTPASRKDKCSQVSAILHECHALALYARDRRDSSWVFL